MIPSDRLNRNLDENLMNHSVIPENAFGHYKINESPVERFWMYDQMDYVIRKLEHNIHSRRAIMVTPDPTDCIVGVQFLVRDKLYAAAWLRSSLKDKRPDDIALIISFLMEVRNELELDIEAEVHVFTSSLHWEVDRP